MNRKAILSIRVFWHDSCRERGGELLVLDSIFAGRGDKQIDFLLNHFIQTMVAGIIFFLLPVGLVFLREDYVRTNPPFV